MTTGAVYTTQFIQLIVNSESVRAANKKPSRYFTGWF